MDQVFAIRQVCEKYQANGEKCILAFMDLEKSYDTDQLTWYVADVRADGVRGKLLKQCRVFM